MKKMKHWNWSIILPAIFLGLTLLSLFILEISKYDVNDYQWIPAIPVTLFALFVIIQNVWLRKKGK